MTRPIFFCLALLVSAFAVAGKDKAAQLDALMKLYQQQEVFNGSVLIAQHGEVVYKAGHGYADMEWEIPNQPNTRHRIGSVTKQFSAVLILKLVAAGKLDLDATVSSILPDYPKETGEKITVHHILRHTSGLPNYTTRAFFAKYATLAKTPTEFLDYFKDKPLDFEPGTNFRYSNSAYFLLGVIIEKVSGKTYDAYLQEQLLDPLGMKDTGYDHNTTILPRRARGYERDAGGLKNADYLHMSLPYAAGSMYSSVEDLYRWDRALAAGKVLPPELMKKMYTPGKNNYGYGWFITERSLPGQEKKTTMIAHGGGINGFNALFARFPSEGLVVALLNNTGNTSLREISDNLLAILYDQEIDPPKQPAFIPISNHIGKPDFQAFCAELLKNRDQYDINEQRLNALGYALIGQKRLEVAHALLSFNVAAFPEAANTYDSLAECLALMGKKDEAIANYRRSLALNPANENATEQIQKLEAR